MTHSKGTIRGMTANLVVQVVGLEPTTSPLPMEHNPNKPNEMGVHPHRKAIWIHASDVPLMTYRHTIDTKITTPQGYFVNRGITMTSSDVSKHLIEEWSNSVQVMAAMVAKGRELSAHIAHTKARHIDSVIADLEKHTNELLALIADEKELDDCDE